MPINQLTIEVSRGLQGPPGSDATVTTAAVEAAGAVMDSEIDADIKTLSLPANTTISTFGASLVDDADSASARTTLGAAASSHTHPAADISDSTAAGRSMLTAADAAAQLALLGAATPASVEAQIGEARGKITIPITPGSNIQAAIDAASPGDHLILLPGTHTPTFVEKTQWDGHKCWVGLQIDKKIILELSRNAILTNPNAINGIRQTPEIVYDQGRWKTLATLASASGVEARADGAISATGTVIITIATIDGGGVPLTYTRSDTGATTYPVVGDQWEALPNNVSFRILSSGIGNNAVGDSFYVSRTAEPIHHIRIGTGTHAAAIDGVRICGEGKIVANATGQLSTLSEVADLSTMILSHGRVTNLTIEGITLDGILERPILIQAEHTGTHYIDTLCKARLKSAGYIHGNGIYTDGGTEYNASNITIRNIITNNSRPILLGHPAHRGGVSYVRVVGNSIHNLTGAGIELNFRLRDFLVTQNTFDAPLAGATLRRGPSVGSVVGNLIKSSDSVILSNASTFPSPVRVVVYGNMTLVANGIINLGVGLATDGNQHGLILGSAYIGSRAGTETQFAVCHADFSGVANSFALMQTSAGATFINAATGQTINFRINNASRGVMNSAGDMAFTNSVTAASYISALVAIGNSGSTKTIGLTVGSFQTVTLTANCTFTLPAAIAGQRFTLKVLTGAGGFTGTFTGAKWPGGAAPVITAAANKFDMISFVSDGAAWIGHATQNYDA